MRALAYGFVIIGIVAVLACFSLFGSAEPLPPPPGEVFIDANGNGQFDAGEWNETGDMDGLQHAVDNATPGDTIYAYGYFFPKGTVVVDKPLTFVGGVPMAGNASYPYCYVRYNEIGFRIASDWVNISWFNLWCIGTDASGIHMENASNCTVSNNVVTDDPTDGIYLENSSNNVVKSNRLVNNGVGIYLTSSSNNNTITNNTIAGIDQTRYATELDLEHFDFRCVTLDAGIVVEDSEWNYIAANNISDVFVGIGAASFDGNFSHHVIAHNTLNGTLIGVLLFGEDNCVIQKNTVTGFHIDCDIREFRCDIENLTIPLSAGVVLVESGASTLLENTVTDTILGIGIAHICSYGSNQTVENNTVLDSIIGVLLVGEEHGTVARNVIGGYHLDVNITALRVKRANVTIPLSAGVIALACPSL
jgi:parallel beta-helix repeat protein